MTRRDALRDILCIAAHGRCGPSVADPLDMKNEWAEMREDIERSVVRLRALIAEAHALNEHMQAPPTNRAMLERIRTAHHDRCGHGEEGRSQCF